MSHEQNFVGETCTITSTTITLTGAISGLQRYSQFIDNGTLVTYSIFDEDSDTKVSGIGIYTANTITDRVDKSNSVDGLFPATNIALTTGTYQCRISSLSESSGGVAAVTTFGIGGTNVDVPDNVARNLETSDPVTTNRLTYGAILLIRPRQMTNLVIKVTVADAGATVSKFGIYTCGVDGSPTNLITSVDVDVSTTGVKIIALPAVLKLGVGWYYSAFATNGSPSIGTYSVGSMIYSPAAADFLIPRAFNPRQTLSGGWTSLPATASGLSLDENFGIRIGWT